MESKRGSQRRRAENVLREREREFAERGRDGESGGIIRSDLETIKKQVSSGVGVGGEKKPREKRGGNIPLVFVATLKNGICLKCSIIFGQNFEKLIGRKRCC